MRGSTHNSEHLLCSTLSEFLVAGLELLEPTVVVMNRFCGGLLLLLQDTPFNLFSAFIRDGKNLRDVLEVPN